MKKLILIILTALGGLFTYPAIVNAQDYPPGWEEMSDGDFPKVLLFGQEKFMIINWEQAVLTGNSFIVCKECLENLDAIAARDSISEAQEHSKDATILSQQISIESLSEATKNISGTNNKILEVQNSAVKLLEQSEKDNERKTKWIDRWRNFAIGAGVVAILELLIIVI